MEKALRIMRIILAVLTAALCLLLIWQAADIWRAGSSPANFTAPGVRIQPVYSRELVGARLRAMAPFIAVYVAAAAALVMEALWGQTAGTGRPALRRPAEQPKKAPAALTAALYAAAAALILAGVYNGGAHDVLVKAVNICTECIGLG